MIKTKFSRNFNIIYLIVANFIELCLICAVSSSSDPKCLAQKLRGRFCVSCDVNKDRHTKFSQEVENLALKLMKGLKG